MKVKVSRKAHFNAAHRLYRPDWSFEKNDSVFGLCNLNVEVEWFKKVNPTAENIAVYIWNLLRPFVEASHELEVILYETPRNYVTFSG